MEKITLKLFEFYNLDAELNGLRNQATGEVITTGILQEKLPLITKYWLTDLAKKVGAEKETIESLKNDLIKKFGEEDDKGGVSIPMVIEEPSLEEGGEPVKKVNPKYLEFEKEFNELLQTEKELEYRPIKLAEFEKVETDQNYATLFKLVQPEADVVPMAPVK